MTSTGPALAHTMGPPPIGTEHQESCSARHRSPRRAPPPRSVSTASVAGEASRLRTRRAEIARGEPLGRAHPLAATHNMLRVATNLLRWSGDERYAEWTERALLNSVLGTQRGAEPGALLYTLPLGQGVSKRDKQAWRTSERGGWSTAFHDWWCCSGTGLEGFARLQAAIFFHSGVHSGGGARGATAAAASQGRGGAPPTLHVMQFISSSVQWSAAGAIVSLNATDPTTTGGDCMEVALAVGPLGGSSPGTGATVPALDGIRAALAVRLPRWARRDAIGDAGGDAGEGAVAWLNGDPFPMPHADDPYLLVERTWRPADALQLRLPLRPRWLPLPDGRAKLHALFFGPYLLSALAHDSSAATRALAVKPTEPFGPWLTRVPQSASAELTSLVPLGGALSGRCERRPTRAAVCHGPVLHASGGLWGAAAPLAEPPQSDRRRRGGGGNASAAATWRMRPALPTLPAGASAAAPSALAHALVFEAFDRPGMYMRCTEAAQVVLAAQGTPFIRRPPLAPPADNSTAHASFERADAPGLYLALSETPRPSLPTPLTTLELAAATAAGQATARTQSTFAMAASAEEYPPLSFWATPDAGPGLLLYPLNEVIDERYNVYLQLSS